MMKLRGTIQNSIRPILRAPLLEIGLLDLPKRIFGTDPAMMSQSPARAHAIWTIGGYLRGEVTAIDA